MNEQTLVVAACIYTLAWQIVGLAYAIAWAAGKQRRGRE